MAELSEIVKKDYMENDPTLCFKTTPTWKVFVLSVLSFGLYDIILIYDYWKTLNKNFGHKVSPFWRTLFLLFTNFRLFPLFKRYFECHGSTLFNGGFLAAIYFVSTWIDNKITFKTLGIDTMNYTLEITSVLLEIICALILVAIQSKINRVNEEYYPDAPKNTWKVSNTIWAIIFVAFTILAFLPA